MKPLPLLTLYDKSNVKTAPSDTNTGIMVRNYVSNIFAKLQVGERAEAIVQVCNAGMGKAKT